MKAIFIAAISILMLPSIASASSVSWWNSGWLYMKKITINNTTPKDLNNMVQ